MRPGWGVPDRAAGGQGPGDPTVDPQARHGRKTAARGFDGYKGHAGIDPDSEIITATTATAGNAGDASVAGNLIADLLKDSAGDPVNASHADDGCEGAQAADAVGEHADAVGEHDDAVGEHDDDDGQAAQARDEDLSGGEPAAVYGDNAYGTGAFHDRLERAGIESKCKTQAPVNTGGRFAKSDFVIDLERGQVTCPAGISAPIRRGTKSEGTAAFGAVCGGCALREACTTAKAGRSITVGAHEAQLAAARARQAHPDWVDDYRATRPKVERKIGHLMRRQHGGRRARVRGLRKVAADFALLAAAVNLARLAVLNVVHLPRTGWTVATTG